MIDLFTGVSGAPGLDEQVRSGNESGGRLSNPEPPVVQPLLRLEFGRGIVLLQPQEAVLLRDALRAIDDPSAVRLATQIDVAATMLLAAPPSMQACGRFALPMTSDQCSSTFRESWSTCRAAASPRCSTNSRSASKKIVAAGGFSNSSSASARRGSSSPRRARRPIPRSGCRRRAGGRGSRAVSGGRPR